MASEFSNINDAYNRQSRGPHSGQSQGQGHQGYKGQGQKYHATQSGPISGSHSGNPSSGSGPSSGQSSGHAVYQNGQYSSQSGQHGTSGPGTGYKQQPQQAYHGDNKSQYGSSNAGGHINNQHHSSSTQNAGQHKPDHGNYPKSREMPPDSNSMAKDHHNATRGQYPNQGSHSSSRQDVRGNNMQHQGTGSQHYQRAGDEKLGTSDQRGRETSGRDHRQKGAAPPRPNAPIPQSVGQRQTADQRDTGRTMSSGQHQISGSSNANTGQRSQGGYDRKDYHQGQDRTGGSSHLNNGLSAENQQRYNTDYTKTKDGQQGSYTKADYTGKSNASQGQSYNSHYKGSEGNKTGQSVNGGYENKAFVKNEYDQYQQQSRPAHHQSSGNINNSRADLYNQARPPSGVSQHASHHQSVGNVNQPPKSHYNNPQSGSVSGGNSGEGGGKYGPAPSHHRSTGNIPGSMGTGNASYNQAGNSMGSSKHGDQKYQEHQPQAPPRRNKSASTMDVSSGAQSGPAYNQNNVNSQPAEKSYHGSYGSKQGTGRDASTPVNMNQSYTESRQYIPEKPPQPKPYDSNQSSTNRDRIVSDSSSSGVKQRKYERNSGAGNTTGKHPPSSGPSSKRRDRMSSSSSTNNGQSGPGSYHGTAPPRQPDGYFDPTPPNRSVSMMALPGPSSSGVSHDPGASRSSSQPPLTRASSLPTISQQVGQGQYGGSMSAINNPGLYRSKSILSMALEGVDANRQRSTNLRHSASLASLVASNPNLARTASTYALYELQVEKGIIPRDHRITMVLSIVSICIMPLLGWIVGSLMLYLTVRNEPNWKLDLYEAIKVNTRLFWGNIGFIALSVLLWIIMIGVIVSNV